ncbi:UNVERIFIED_CONTAM: glycosyltransferase, group 2 family protein [Hammondia hammondi]|eukprot:XP_008888744.1 glycosyltransferase, group 2 family protein [Hammondia hammondi]
MAQIGGEKAARRQNAGTRHIPTDAALVGTKGLAPRVDSRAEKLLPVYTCLSAKACLSLVTTVLVAIILYSLSPFPYMLNEYPRAPKIQSLAGQLDKMRKTLCERRRRERQRHQPDARMECQADNSAKNLEKGKNDGEDDILLQARPLPSPDFDADGQFASLKQLNNLPNTVSISSEAPDWRVPECKHKASVPIAYDFALRLEKYDLTILPATSIIIAFYNEYPTALQRTLHSILHRTPLQLIEEIILVDDGSTFPFITDDKAPQSLSQYVKTLPKVRLLRHQTRKGVTVARSTGIRAAKSHVFVILDSHVEVGYQWLEPLVARVASNPETIVFPVVDAVDYRTLEFKTSGVGCTLGLIWSVMEHGFVPLSPERLAYSPGAYRPSPTMMGSVFAADKNYFLEHGGYDEGMRFEGAENIELSLRQWQCGGRLECSPCSRVFHLFRSGADAQPVPLYSLLANKVRTMAVWMDEYGDLAW